MKYIVLTLVVSLPIFGFGQSDGEAIFRPVSWDEVREVSFYSPENKKDSITRILEENGRWYEWRGKYDSSIYYLMEALRVCSRSNYIDPVADILNQMGLIAENNSDLAEAYSLYSRAKKYAILSGEPRQISSSMYNIGKVHFYSSDQENLQATVDQKIKYDRRHGLNSNIIDAYLLKTALLGISSKPDESLRYIMNKSDWIKSYGTVEQLFLYYSNMAFLHDSQFNREESYRYRIMAMQLAELYNYERLKSTSYQQLAVFHSSEANMDSALYYINKCLSIAEKIKLNNLLTYAYKTKARVMRDIGELDSLNYYRNKYYEANSRIVNMKTLTQVVKAEQRYENELKAKKMQLQQQEIALLEKDKNILRFRNWLLIALSVFALVAFVLIYRAQRNKRLLEKESHIRASEALESEKKIAEIELEKQELENQKLEEEVAYKNKELNAFADNILQKQELLEAIYDEVKKGSIPKTQQLSQLINSSLTTEKEEFQSQIDQINSLFFKKLQDAHPELSSSELRILSLIKMELSSKEISTILNIDSKSVDMARYRVRKKMELDRGVQLKKYLDQF